ncbi:unnamed protein product, partial [Polarella glacialis]
VSTRVVAAACFVVPLVMAIPYGSALFAHSQLLRQVLLRPLLPLLRVYHANRFSNMIAIVGMYWLARNRSTSPFLRAVGFQASTLMMMQFPANFLLQFFASTPGPIANLARGSIFAYFMYCVFMGILGVLTGTASALAFIVYLGHPTKRRADSFISSTKLCSAEEEEAEEADPSRPPEPRPRVKEGHRMDLPWASQSEQRTKLWQLIDAAQEEAQAALGRRSSELLADLTQAQAGARTVAGKLQDVECEEAQRARKLEEARRSAAAFAKEAQAFAAAHKSLEAELKVQRDATAAWQACATGLVSEQKGLSEEAARAASDCREALGWGSVGGPESRPVPGAAGRAALQDWSSAPLLTARTSQGSGTHLCPPGGPSSSDPREGPGPECPDWQPDVPPDAPGGVWDSRGERSSSELLNSSFGGPERPAPDWHLRQEGPHQASVDFALAAARHAASELDLAVTEGGESEGSATSPTFSPLAMSALAFLAPL